MKFTAIPRAEEWLLPNHIKSKHNGNGRKRMIILSCMSTGQIKYNHCFFLGGRGGRTVCEEKNKTKQKNDFCFYRMRSGGEIIFAGTPKIFCLIWCPSL